MVEKEKALHPEWSRNQIGEAVRQKLKQSPIFTDSRKNLAAMDLNTAYLIATLLFKVGWFGWKVYKGNTELPDEVEEWIEAVLDALP